MHRCSVPVSVIIPAHNEAKVIDRCLRSLLTGAEASEIDVVVVCNGCTDDTAVRAERYSGVRVVEIDEASKSAALNAGEVETDCFPRFYVDADVQLHIESVRAVAKVLERGTALCAAPRPAFELTGRPYVVRAFYNVWGFLPFMTEEPVGNGVYALGREGRSRFTKFPDVTSDDLFIRNLFATHERQAVDEATFTIHTPTRSLGLLWMRVRVYRGNDEWRRRFPEADSQAGPRGRRALALVGEPRRLPALLIYVLLNLTAKSIATWRRIRNVTTWERDESSRDAGLAT